MKKHYLAFVALAAAAVATSCSTDELAQQQEQNQTGPQTVTLTASVDSSNDVTRVGMTKVDNSKASFYWHKDDKIFVQTENNGAYDGAEFTTTETATGEESATFTGEVTGTVGQYAVYPSGSHTFTGENTLTYNLPASYEYKTVEKNIFSKDGTYPSNSTNMPMLGTITENTISFKSIGGLAVIRIDKMPVAEGTLTVTADQQLCGNFTVENLSASDAQIATPNTTTATDNTVTFTFSGATKDDVGVFYLPLATGDYTNLTIKISDSDGANAQTVPYGSLTVARASVTAIPLFTDSKGDLRYIVKTGDYTYIVNGHKFVDLGLSVLWAETNIGAEKASDYGSYFFWGETTAKTDFRGTYDTALSTKYNTNGGLTTLESSDDAATVNWGAGVRMPTEAEMDELISCDRTWTTSDNVYGCQVTSKKEGYTSNSIFLPAAGYYSGQKPLDLCGHCNYWSNQLTANGVPCLDFTSDMNQTSADIGRDFGLPVRAVAEKPTTTE